MRSPIDHPLNDLLTQLKEEAKVSSWAEVVRRYGALRGMIAIAARHDDMSLMQLFSAIGTRERLRELLSIPEDVDLSGWRWKARPDVQE